VYLVTLYIEYILQQNILLSCHDSQAIQACNSKIIRCISWRASSWHIPCI